MAAAALPPTLIGPYPGLDLTTPAFTRHRSAESVGPSQRADVSQLTLHDFHKCQQSPLLSTSPEYEHRRVKKKPSVDSLADHTANANAPLSCSTTPISPFLIRPLPSRDQFASILPQSHPHPHPHPHRPTTPRLQHVTTSPSLSSTVTTLQSTPTHTPVFRGGLPFERRRIDEGSALVEPLRTKRKFQTLKRAKRLPHTVGGGGSSSNSSSRGANDVWEVYAAVFDPPVDSEGDIASETSAVVGRHEERGESARAQQGGRGGKGVHFATGQVPEGSGGHQADATEDTSQLARLHKNQELAGTSSYSLSKFEFPVPPGHDNWAGTFGHLSKERAPITPTTLLYRGASFDVVNPHASLLLDVYNLETPAEIDGLLDDYFNEPDTDNVQHHPLTGNMSQHSLRSPTESSRRSRKLYKDADLARRSIMRSYDELPSPPAAYLHSSPSGYRSYASMPTPPDSVHDFRTIDADSPKPLRRQQWNTNAFRNLSAALGIGSNGEEGMSSHNAVVEAEEGRATRFTPAAPTPQVHSADSVNDRSRRSNPFDLAISDSGSDVELVNISKVIEQGRREEGRSVVTRTSDNEGESSQATCAEPEADPTIREILDGYDYTRVHPFEDPGSSSIEHGLGVVLEASNEDGSSGLGPPISSSTQQPATRDEPRHTPRQAEFAASSLPTPPAPAYVGPRYYSGCSELPTSDRTYGETNQLLQITPEVVQYAPYSPGEKRYESPSTRRFADYYAATSMPLDEVRPRADSDPSKPILSTYKPVLSNNKENVPPEGSNDPRGDDPADVEELLEGERTFRFFDPGPADAFRRSAHRASSHYHNDAESGWESEFTDSHYDLPRALSQQSLASYADTSVAGSQHRTSIDDGIPEHKQRETVLEGVSDDGPPKIGIGLSKTFTTPFSPNIDSEQFKKVTGFGMTRYSGVEQDARSDRHQLLGPPDDAPRTPRPGELAYSPSVGTMTTVREAISEANGGPTRLWSQFGREPSSGVVGLAKEGHVITFEPKRSLRAVTGQHELKELRLVKPRARDRPRRGWTDAQYLARSRGWRDAESMARARGWADDQGLGPRPYMTANSPLAKYTDPRSSSFDARISAKRFLVDPKLEDYYPPVLYEERKAISKEVLKWLAAFPPLTLAFGLGYFDGYICRKTNGRITKMAPAQKYEALYVYCPLGSLLWAIVAVVAAILILGFQLGAISSGGNSAPF